MVYSRMNAAVAGRLYGHGESNRDRKLRKRRKRAQMPAREVWRLLGWDTLVGNPFYWRKMPTVLQDIIYEFSRPEPVIVAFEHTYYHHPVLSMPKFMRKYMEQKSCRTRICDLVHIPQTRKLVTNSKQKLHYRSIALGQAAAEKARNKFWIVYKVRTTQPERSGIEAWKDQAYDRCGAVGPANKLIASLNIICVKNPKLLPEH